MDKRQGLLGKRQGWDKRQELEKIHRLDKKPGLLDKRQGWDKILKLIRDKVSIKDWGWIRDKSWRRFTSWIRNMGCEIKDRVG